MKYRNIHISPKYSEGERVYYGSVPGVPEIDMIEAATQEEFERLFHEAVDEYLLEKRVSTPKRKKGWLYFVSALIALVVIALLTCPDKSKHVEVLKDKVGSVLNEQLIDENSNELEFLGMALVNGVLGKYINNYVTVNDYALFNVGKATLDGKTFPVSIGVFGHVFSVPRKIIEERLNESKEFQDLLEFF